jgi:hypothetical protein
MQRTPNRILAALMLLSSTMAVAQQPPAQPCPGAAFRQFDFWVGEWEVRNAQDEPVGRNTITLEQNGCVLIERWTSARGGTGLSMNHYDPLAQAWRQHWVGLGIMLEMRGGLTDGAMVLEGPLQYVAENRVTMLRGVWTPLPDGRVRQHFKESSDGGKTWTDWFDGYYSKKK